MIASDEGYVNGETGKNSLWDDKGGRAYGTCTAAGYEQKTYDCWETVNTDECQVGYYLIGSVDTNPMDTNDKKISCTNGYENTGFPVWAMFTQKARIAMLIQKRILIFLLL